MLRLLLTAMLLGGCSAAPAMPDARFALNEAAEAPQGRLTSFFLAPGQAVPRSGTWVMTWQLGGETLERELDLSFMPDGTIELASEPGFWSGDTAEFGGICGGQMPDMRTGFGCEQYRMTIGSERTMKGTVTMPINHRPVTLPASAQWRPSTKL